MGPSINPSFGKFVVRHLKTDITTHIIDVNNLSETAEDSSTNTISANYQEKLAQKDYMYTKIDFSECKLGSANMPFLDQNNF